MLLKNGVESCHVRLDRIPELDDRSRNFCITRTVPTSNKKLLSAKWKVPINLDQGYDGACFPSGTLIKMASGVHKRIEDIKVLDKVVTAEGNVKRVLQTMVRRTSKLTTVNFRGYLPIQCTPEHPFLTLRGYVPANELLVGDKVLTTKFCANKETFSNPIDLTKARHKTSGSMIMGGVPVSVLELPEKFDYTRELGRIIGLYAAEGNVTAGKVVFTFGKHERHTLVQETVALIRSCFGVEARIQERTNALNVCMYGVAWVKLFSLLVPGTSKHGDKRLSSIACAGTPEYLKEVIYGWLAGDGHTRRGSDSGYTVCRQLAIDMYSLGLACGLCVSLHYDPPRLNKYAKTRQGRYTLGVSKTYNNSSSVEVTELGVWRKVTDVEERELEKPIWVFNMHVDDDNSYVADGLGVHNCAGFGVTHALAADPNPVPGLGYAWAKELYYEAQRTDRWEGGEYEGANPKYAGTSILAAIKVVKKLGYITEYNWAFTFDDFLSGLCHSGPCIIGVNWYAGMGTTTRKGFITPNGYKLGGHCVLVSGINVPGEFVTIHNSWGKQWGVNGEAFIKFRDMEKLLHETGEAVFLVKPYKPII